MTSIEHLLGDKAEALLGFNQPKISKDRLHLPGPDVVDRLFSVSNRSNRVLANLQRLFTHGRLGGTWLPFHSAGGPGHRTFGGREFREESRLF